MKKENIGKGIWEAAYLVLVAVILSYCWISFRMEILSPVSLGLPPVVLVAALCGGVVYLFIGELRKAFYASLAMCTIACAFTALFFVLPIWQGFQAGWALDFAVMAIFVVPFCVGGCFVASYLLPD